MTMREGQQWICSDPHCRSEVFVIAAVRLEAAKPRCSCGSPMKTAYTTPKVRSVVDPAERRNYQERVSLKVRGLRQGSPAST